MIPKIIHYCWFGGKKKPMSVIKMINSWKKYCPDYEIKEWNESNFDININRYVKDAYECGKWAFVSDVARLYALYTEGGIYMDTDVEVVRPLDNLLDNNVFLGFEGTEWVGTNMIGATNENSFIKEFLDLYKSEKFINNDNTLNTTTNVERLTDLLKNRYGVLLNGTEQKLNGIHLYTSDYFCPYDYINGKLSLSNNTYSIHWYSQSWIKRGCFKRRISQLYHRFCGIKMK